MADGRAGAGKTGVGGVGERLLTQGNMCECAASMCASRTYTQPAPLLASDFCLPRFPVPNVVVVVVVSRDHRQPPLACMPPRPARHLPPARPWLCFTRHALALPSLSPATTHIPNMAPPPFTHSLTHSLTHPPDSRKTPCRRRHAAPAAAPISTYYQVHDACTSPVTRCPRSPSLPLSPALAASIHPAVAVTLNRQPPVHLSLAPRAGYPASCLHRVPAYLYFVLHHDFTYSHVPPTHLPPSAAANPR
ncbi:hypothetical protein PSV09DRAFT_2254686 [Bipolaris maydis]|uniref:uncharacterized protein n=1 Tax=Cochliobolus heterostrophus TaxID=5016 RepID=UPI0024D206DB|nr:hypothetical protein J3E73DRAFT_404619 [Bipolaris maydis]KAJ5065305.1 hypothetical protein J3E74DRAFT_285778 [Bipolaris maydis]KAJ6213645.1 hypothetical protein PSV09DRAFT_2254686 [Bipolaris maydis]KAJ6274861.1 hypothetical protein PSV08DRAFT_384498 [Bipolaris maydis]KAJ6285852.1 hypothetical protein J3E71DRAFT_236745 [Bipolaris maydis]